MKKIDLVSLFDLAVSERTQWKTTQVKKTFISFVVAFFNDFYQNDSHWKFRKGVEAIINLINLKDESTSTSISYEFLPKKAQKTFEYCNACGAIKTPFRDRIDNVTFKR